EEIDDNPDDFEDVEDFEDNDESEDDSVVAKGDRVAVETTTSFDDSEDEENSEDSDESEEDDESEEESDDEISEEGDLTEDEWEDSDYYDSSYSALVAYDMEGNKLWLTDLKSYNSYDGGDTSSSINSISKDGDKILLSVNKYDMNSGDTSMVYYDVDIQTGKVSSEPNADNDVSKFSLVDEYTYSDNEYSFDNCVVIPYYHYAEDYSSVDYSLQIIKDGEATLLDLTEIADSDEVYGVANVFSISDEELLLVVYTEKGDVYAQLNINSMSSEIVEVSDELKNLAWGIIQLDGKMYVSDNEGLYQVDYKAGTKEMIFSFTECNVNLNDISAMQPLSVSDDEVIFAGSVYTTDATSSMSNETYGVYKFTRASSNPNAGKTILRAASTTYLNEAAAEAIYQFNQSSDKFFITYSNKYSAANIYIDDTSDMTNDDYSLFYLKASSDLNSQLAMDLMNGEGPDIIFDSASFTQMNNSDYLVDLSEYVSGLSSDRYYTNIFDACRTGEALYQLPISMYCNAMIAPEGASSNGKGFTFDEYISAVDEYNNGNDPLIGYSGRLSVFTELLEEMETPIVDENGEVNLNSEEFRAICEYCAELPEMPEFGGNEDFVGSGYMYDDTQMMRINTFFMYDIGSYLYDMFRSEEEMAIYGMPSYNGKGPSIGIESSVAISASCANVDGAWEFVNTMLQDDILSKLWGMSISKNNMQLHCEDAIESYNDEVEENLKWSTKQELISYGMPYEKISEADAQKALDFIESIDSVIRQDGEITTIITEEIQPFFAGQKSLDEVISIMEDKCQTVVNERG
ncbi:MAG: extracellular solute-binding protein, partial [Clostridia bacterium]|nr:extracellular solute-binding protein [Clostridia bacterium]